VFIAGDFATGPRSVVEAIASGREMALAADRYLGGSGEFNVRLTTEQGSAVLGRAEGFTERTRLEPVSSTTRAWLSLNEVAPGLGSDRAATEADRCLRCDLRLEYRKPVWPPSGRSRLVLAASSLESVPEVEGVLRFLDSAGEIAAIVGTANLRLELSGALGAQRATQFEFEICPMYTQRQNELLAQFVEAHGRMPAGLGGDDDVDDLF
jgi:formate dehydrogenase (NADP+) beta subunit